MTEEKLRALIAESQRDGFKVLFKQYQNYVYTIVWGRIRKIGSAEDAEEAVSDTFAEVFLNFSTINSGSLQAYIGTVAKRKAIDKYRKLSSEKTVLADDGELLNLPDDTDIAADSETLERNRLIYEKIRSLGEPDASLIIQKYYYDRKSKDIARDLNMTPGAVRVRLNRALKKLRELLKDISLK
ncbi:MAG: sigma-70 family RNA polymerase sigma factor [Ruminococcus sp.]|nr:sigma-70 family RNA polymerase sigma factor [Ruminococcus sp.]MBO5164914.1 sigma-70 family RNA polymerase sigma factor [Ruminococcus sp.]